MEFTNENVKELVESFIPFIKKIIREETSDCLRINVAKVISVDDDGTCVIRYPNDPTDGSNDMTVSNKYGLQLVAGDIVNVQYWNNLSDVYIVSKYTGSENFAPKPITNGQSLKSIPIASWDENNIATITIQDMDIKSTSTIFISPFNNSYSEWCFCGVRCLYSQTDTVKFKCDSIPTHDMLFNIVVWNV